MVLGVGCLLFSDEGFGIRVIEKLEETYTFPENVSLVDGGVLGINLLGWSGLVKRIRCHREDLRERW